MKRPIIGKFEHQVSGYLRLRFDNDTTTVGVTGTHPFWSEDRHTWVKAQGLNIGENLKTQHGTAILTQRQTLETKTTVYNLEVYQDHSYLVSEDRLLVHNNGCPPNKKNGNTTSIQLGRQKHKEFKLDQVSDTKFKEFELPSGKRSDFVDFDNKAVWELKPNNKRAKRKGIKQLDEYHKELESIHGPGWTKVLTTY